MKKYILIITLLVCSFSWAEIPMDIVDRLGSQDVDQQIDACFILGNLGDIEAVGLLENKLNNKSILVRHSAANALARIGGEKVIVLFQEMIKKGGVEAKRVGLAGLAMSGDPNSLEVVISELNNPNWQVRWSAVYALGQWGCRKALSQLEDLAENDPYFNKATNEYPVRKIAKEVRNSITNSIEWYRSLEDAWLLSEKFQKPLFIYWTVNNSDWCRLLEEKVLFSPEVSDLSQMFVCLKLDVKRNDVLVTRYEVEGAPCILILDREGHEVDRILGVVDKDKLVKRMKDIIQEKNTPKKWKAILKKNPNDIKSSWHLSEWYMDNGKMRKAIPLLEVIIQNDTRNDYGYTDNALFLLGFCLGGKGDYGRAVKLLEALQMKYPRFKDMSKALYCLGLDYLMVNKVEKAEMTFNKILNEYPQSGIEKQVKSILEEIKRKK